jgi:acid ceramidase
MLTIDLDTPPRERWADLAPLAQPARALLDLYERDLGPGAQASMGLISEVASQVLPAETLEELVGVAAVLEVPVERVLLCNLYYDLIKSSVGCSAFAVDLPDGPLHARNLDWWTTGGLLRDHTLVTQFLRRGALRYRLIGWPGFIGCFSGVAPGRFSVTVNAVLSDEPACVAEPVVFLLRRVLDVAPTFDAALSMLRDSPIASDCLLLLCGTQRGEFVVIERTPTRAQVRRPEDGVLFVTNDYRSMPPGTTGSSELTRTSCARGLRLRQLLSAHAVASPSEAFAVLADPGVRMDMTVQHMVLRPVSGACEVQLPE